MVYLLKLHNENHGCKKTCELVSVYIYIKYKYFFFFLKQSELHPEIIEMNRKQSF